MPDRPMRNTSEWYITIDVEQLVYDKEHSLALITDFNDRDDKRFASTKIVFTQQIHIQYRRESYADAIRLIARRARYLLRNTQFAIVCKDNGSFEFYDDEVDALRELFTAAGAVSYMHTLVLEVDRPSNLRMILDAISHEHSWAVAMERSDFTPDNRVYSWRAIIRILCDFARTHRKLTHLVFMAHAFTDNEFKRIANSSTNPDFKIFAVAEPDQQLERGSRYVKQEGVDYVVYENRSGLSLE